MTQVHWTSIAALVAVIAMAVALAYLWKNGYIGTKTFAQLDEIIEGLPAVGDGEVGLFLERLRYYARIAIDAVEQMVNSGALERDNKKRLEAAVEIVNSYALCDGYELDEMDKTAVRSLIEAQLLHDNHTDT